MTEPEMLIKVLSASSKIVAAAESCTAGLVADLLAQVPGASQVFWGSFVSYTVPAKIKMLGLDKTLIQRYGAVSAETARAMARAVLEQSSADMAVSVTGLAGPLGDGSHAPVGTVWIGTAARGKEAQARKFHYTGSRGEVRNAAALQAVRELLQLFDFN